jgi:hypothetical protein
VGETAAQRATAKAAERRRVEELAAAEAARRVEEEARVQAARLAEAAEELSRRRAEAEAEASRRQAAAREAMPLPAIVAQVGRDAVRLVSTLATAPFRIGFALLRPREA